MSIGKLAVSWYGGFDAVIGILSSWTPSPAKSEDECQQQLADLMRACTPHDATVEREYFHSGCKVDLYVGLEGIFGGKDEIYFEAKLDLKLENDYKRLVGQIETMEPTQHNIIVILFGETKPEFASRLRKKYVHDSVVIDLINSPKIAIIEKPFAAAGSKA